MTIQRIRPIANDRPKDQASCKWSSRGFGLLQMIIQRISPFANDHTEDLATCIWSCRGPGLLQMIMRHPRLPNHLSQDPDLISRTFLEQFALVSKYSPAVLMICKVFKDQCSWFAEFLKSSALPSSQEDAQMGPEVHFLGKLANLSLHHLFDNNNINSGLESNKEGV